MSLSMDFTSFSQIILDQVRKEIGKNDSVFLKNIVKNNGTIKTGVIIKREGRNALPAVYINDFYHDNMTEDEVREISDTLVREFLSEEPGEELDLSGFIEFERARKKLVYKLISAERNREFLKSVPHRIFHNLAIVLYYTVQEPPFYGNAAIQVQNTQMNKWKSNPEELFALAWDNTPVLFPGTIESMEVVMREVLREGLKEEREEESVPAAGREEDILPGPSDESWMDDLIFRMANDLARGKMPMYVLTNRQKLFGAACMLYPGLLQRFAGRAERDFYILPSSVHEVILIPADAGPDRQALREIVTDINRTQVAEEEVLSDSVYYYSRRRDKIMWIL